MMKALYRPTFWVTVAGVKYEVLYVKTPYKAGNMCHTQMNISDNKNIELKVHQVKNKYKPLIKVKAEKKYTERRAKNIFLIF